MQRLVIIFAVLLSLTGCSTITLVENKQQTVAAILLVEPQLNWNRLMDGPVEVWTVDGTLLQALRFVAGVADGESIFPKRNSEQQLPVFRHDMVATEIQELVVDTVAALGAGDLSVSDLKPAAVGVESGFQFEMKFLSLDGLEQDGLVLGLVHSQKLHLIIYSGERSYYYPKYLPQVEQMLRTIRLAV